MRSVLRGRLFRGPAVALLLALGASPVACSPRQDPSLSARYGAALERWHAALDPGGPSLRFSSSTPYFGGPGRDTELNAAVADLSSIGANMIPFMVDQIRRDLRGVKDALAASPAAPELNTTYETAKYRDSAVGRAAYRLDLDVELMFMLGGMQIRLGMPDFGTATWLRQIDGFLNEWETGTFANPDARLHDVRKASAEVPGSVPLDFKRTFPYRRYGVYALPLLIAEIRRTNSAECFSAFLIITFQRDLHLTHYQNPHNVWPTVDEKMDHIRAWWRDNAKKFDQLGTLPEKIQAAIGSSRSR